MRKNSGVTELGVAEYLLRDLPRQHGARVHARWWTISSQRRCHHGLTARISSMVTIGLRSSVYRTHGAGHRLWCSFGNLLLLLWWLELARVGVFYYENREQFRSLKLPILASQTIEAFPDGFELTVHKPSPGTHPTLSINRELPFSLPLPAWCGTVMSLLLGHMSRTNLSAEDAAELLPVPRILFTTERGLRELGGEAHLLHLVLTETRTHASASRTLTLAPDLALASSLALALASTRALALASTLALALA